MSVEPTGAAGLDDGVAMFAEVRPRLFGIAYRMLGTVGEAEDIVQDAWLRWQGTDRSVVLNPGAFLATTTTRLAINAAQSARARHETTAGQWLPEPVDTSADPALGAERAEALELALLLLMEKLPPTERAAYVLREAFDYPYEQIADVIQVREANARQLVSRARKHIADGRRATVSSVQRQRLLTAFVHAARTGDLAGLEHVLASDVISYAEGGGSVPAARWAVAGRDRVAKMVAAFSTHFWVDAELTWLEANGQPSVVLARDGVPYALLTVTASADGIDELLWAMNPRKLTHVGAADRG